MILLAVVIFRSYRNKKRANKLLAEQKSEIEFKNVELEQQKEEITAQRDEIETQSVVITEQRDVALRQKKEITDSIHYAKRIQNAILPTRKMFAEDLSDYFILFQPRDIVSGDFYWMTKKNRKLIIAAADCTGHGVPGAFMSMLGVSFLNEIVNKAQITESNLILEKLRENVIESLHQTGKDDEAKDGMDIALCIIDTENNTLQFSGAYNPLYLINKNGENQEITEIKPDRMPIGIYMSNMKPYTERTISLQKGDTLYIFSDGYIDQFGGEHGRKLKAQSFKNILLEIQQLSMSEQKLYLENFMKNWQKSRSQIDDILVIGMRY
jgi:serine phosphatase RsbU (regulator of sigma subunit)